MLSHLPLARTRRGNAGKSSCFFPFVYNGVTYNECTTADYDSNKPWCATSPDYRRDKQWAECVLYPESKYSETSYFKPPSEEFELTANSLGAHIETQGKLILRTPSYLTVNSQDELTL